MRVLVTGADGFVGGHLCEALDVAGDTILPMCGSNASNMASRYHGAEAVDVRSAQAVQDFVLCARPDAIIHLAASSSVAQSHADPLTTFEVNARGTLNVCVAARALPSSVRVLLVSSGEVYGVATEKQAREESRLAPLSPYAASKAAAEAIALQFARSYGLHVVVARPFPHLGVGQASGFAVPSFARQLLAVRQTGRRGTLSVGNLDPVRDLSHVRDVVSAYRLLIERAPSGEAYNVCSGAGRSIRSVLDELIELTGVAVDVQVDPAKLRPTEIPNLVGNPAKLRALGWIPRWSVRDALLDVLEEIRSTRQDHG